MITQKYLKKFLDYNSTTGEFIWKVSTAKRIKIGNIAGSIDKEGYIPIKINNKIYKAHRLAWLYMYGEWPKNHIDHINGITNDNRIANLRDVTRRENQQNRVEHRAGKLLGASYFKRDKKWVAQIIINGKRKHIGLYNTEIEAHEAYISMKWLLSEVEEL